MNETTRIRLHLFPGIAAMGLAVWRIRAGDGLGGALLGFAGILILLLLAKYLFDLSR
jgi:hypothetical protein